jgi:hypothetical protein
VYGVSDGQERRRRHIRHASRGRGRHPPTSEVRDGYAGSVYRGKEYQTEEEVVGYYTTGDRMKAWGKTGASWGGLWGLMFGSAFFLIPGIGPLFAAGPLVSWIIGALEGEEVVGGLGALGAGLYSIGIPKDSIIEYETQIKAGKYVVIAHGTEDEVGHVESALAPTSHQGIKKHACCG